MTQPLSVLSAPQHASPQVIQQLFPRPMPQVPYDSKEPMDSAKHLKKKTTVYFVLTLALILIYGALFFFPQLSRYLNANSSLAALQSEVQQYDQVILADLEKTRLKHQAAYQDQLHQIESVMNEVFPVTIDKTGITERLETFASLIHSKSPPFELNRLTFGNTEKKNGLTVLPISTQIHASRANLDRFMKLIDLSGKLDSEYHVRLMEIEQIDIRYLGKDSRTGEDMGVDANILLRAYSRLD